MQLYSSTPAEKLPLHPSRSHPLTPSLGWTVRVFAAGMLSMWAVSHTGLLAPSLTHVSSGAPEFAISALADHHLLAAATIPAERAPPLARARTRKSSDVVRVPGLSRYGMVSVEAQRCSVSALTCVSTSPALLSKPHLTTSTSRTARPSAWPFASTLPLRAAGNGRVPCSSIR